MHDWLAGMALPDGQKPFNIVEVGFKGTRKEYFRNTDNVPLKAGEMVAVEGSPGHDIGTVTLTGELVKLQLIKHRMNADSKEIKQLYRTARPLDIEKWNAVKAQEVKTMYNARVIAGKHRRKAVPHAIQKATIRPWGI